jgi:Tol biopolymer transport system component/DNA-binding winged helix-turn-helix (wHTH) protein
MTDPLSIKRIRFGPYDADLSAGELRRNGRPVRVQVQPFQVLAALLEHPGEVVTREQLRERLWAGQTFVDFDQGLNTAINKLREALGDSVASPRFIETLPKRGYRFLFPIEADPGDSSGSPQVSPKSREAQQPTNKFRALRAGLAVLAMVAVGVALVSMRWPATFSELPLRRFSIQPPGPIGFSFYSTLVAISPNGRRIAFVVDQGAGKLWIQDLDRLQPRAIDGTEGALAPFWSPDSSFIGFAAGGVLKKVSVDGGSPTRLCELPSSTFYGGAWTTDGESIGFSSGEHPAVLYKVAAAGGTPQVWMTQELLLNQLPASMGDRRELLTRCIINPQFLSAAGDGLLAFTLGSRLVIQDLRTGRAAVLGAGDLPVYSPSGHLIYRSVQETSDLWAQPFSLETLEATGAAFRIANNGMDPSVAADGTLVYLDGFSDQLVWLNRQGERIGEVGKPGPGIYYPALSPDGRFVAAEAMENFNLDVWVYEIASGARTRLSADPAIDILPVWSPRGEAVAFGTYRAGSPDILLRSADAAAEETVLAQEPEQERVSDWSRDGEYILYSLLAADSGHDLWYMKRDDKGAWEHHPFLQTAFHERVARFSPDGRYAAYLSDESGRNEVYVRTFPDGGRKWAVSNTGAAQLRWRRDGRELFYVDAGTLVAVPVRTEPEFSAGPPQRLFSHAALTQWLIDANYDVSGDGQRILLPERVGAQGRERRIHVVQNWFAEFRDRQR